MTHEDRSTDSVDAGAQVRNVAASPVSSLTVVGCSAMTLIFAIFLVVALFGGLDDRVKVLERICHGQCKYGDAECAKRCADAGHCEFE